MSGNLLTKDQILGVQDIQTETVEVPEWGGAVIVRGMNGRERDSFEASMIKGKGKSANVNLENLRAKLVSKCIVDEAGKRLFSDDDIPALAAKSAAALNRVYEVAQRLSGVTEDDVDELVKNSETAQSEPSGSS